MSIFLGKAEATNEETPIEPPIIGETFITFFQRHNYVVPNYDDRDYEDVNSVWFKDSTGLHKKAIVRPIVIKGEIERIILNPILSECMQKFETPPSSPKSLFHFDKKKSNRETPSGNLIRQGPIAFLIATQKGHSTLIVTCGNKIFGIGAIMSEAIECVVVEPTFMEKTASWIKPDIRPNTEEFALDVVSPDPIFNLFTTKRSSTGISYAAGTIVGLVSFTYENSQNLLNFLNQTDNQREKPWIITEKRYDTGEVYETEINTNVKYMTTSSPFRGTADIMNCANFLELIFAGIISGSAYGGLVSIPESIRIIKGQKHTIEELDGSSQESTIFSEDSSADMHEENSGDSGNNDIYGLKPLVLEQPHMQDILRIGSPPGSPKNKAAKVANPVKFKKIKKTPKKTNGFGIINIKTLHHPRRKKITRREKEREKKRRRRTTRKRKTRRSTN